MNFTDFTLDGGLQEGLAEAGYVTCMPVQEQVLKIGLDGADLYVQSQTGTGKTAAYLVTILQRLVSDPSLSGKKALIMVPTRELAVQVEEEARILGSCMKLKSASFYGGVGYGRQIELLKEGMDVIIGTPGRVIDLQQSGQMDLSKVAFLVIDEADRMFDMGFLPDVRKILAKIPSARQTLMFSATMPPDIRRLANEVLHDPLTLQIEHAAPPATVSHALYPVSHSLKTALLLKLLKQIDRESVLVFTRTKHRAEKLARQLVEAGHKTTSLRGDLTQNRRKEAMDGFRSGAYHIMVATDIAARGLDVSSISHVINFDMPATVDDYVHRIGRTGRAAKTGDAFTLVTREDEGLTRAIERRLGAQLERRTVADFNYHPESGGGETPRAKGKPVVPRLNGTPYRPGAYRSRFQRKSGGPPKRNRGGRP